MRPKRVMSIISVWFLIGAIFIVTLSTNVSADDFVSEMWVDDDYTSESCGGHTWGIDAFNRIQAAIYAAERPDPGCNPATINILNGIYYERITIDKPVILDGESSTYTVIDGKCGDKWAIICVSANDMGTTDNYPDVDCFPAQGLQAYYALKSRGYDDNHIVFMLWHDDEQEYEKCEDNPNTEEVENDGDDIDEWININYFTDGNWKNELWGLDGIKGNSDDPVIDVDNKAVTKAALEYELSNLAGQVTRDDHVLFYFVNHGRKHGTPEKCHLYFEDDSGGEDGHWLDASTLDSWLDQIDCKRMTILIDICRTQSFIESESGLTAEPNRMIIGAAGDINNIAHAWFQARYEHPSDGSHFAGSWFFHPFWEEIDNAKSVQKAYQIALEASDQMAEDHEKAYQYPILFDKVRDSNKYSLVPYPGNTINFVNDPGAPGGEIRDCKILGGGQGGWFGINLENQYVSVTQAIVNDNSVGYTDVTSECSDDDEVDFNFFPDSETTDDSFMISGPDIFNRIYVELSTSGAGSGGSFVVECATDRDEWVEATIEYAGFYLTQTSDIRFIPPLEWAYQSHIHPVSDEMTEYGYWVRLRIEDPYETNPQGDYTDLSHFFFGNSKFIDNRITNNDYGISLKGIHCDQTTRGPIYNCEIKDNEIDSNGCGIYLEHCEETEIEGNDIHDNYYGIMLYDCKISINSHANEIIGNSIYENTYGISICSSETNNIFENTIESNTYGISLSNSKFIKIYHNNFIDNINQACDNDPNSNYWHDPQSEEGNYWSDYTGLDDGSGTGKHAIADDGIGDTNIPHPGSGFDNYPFMEQDGWV